MVEIVSKKDLTFLGGALVLMLLINAAVIGLQNYFSQNFVIAFTVFVLVYSAFVLWFIFDETPSNVKIGLYVKTLVAWVLVFLALDIIVYPILVTPTGIPAGLPTNAMISSDVYIYSLLPAAIPVIARYYMTYVLAPAIFLFVAYKLLAKNEKKFEKIVKSNL